jgi:AAA domain
MSTTPEARLDKLGSVETIGVVRVNPAGEFGEWDAGDDTAPIPPRAWLLGTTFCRRYISSLMAGGGAGKSALRIAQCLALATGRPITGEYVFRRARVLIVSLEDDADELRRRVRAAMLHHNITFEEVKGWLFLATPAGMGWKIAQLADGKAVAGELGPELEKVIRRRQIDLVVLDPFLKAHACEENANGQIDLVVGILAQIASACNCAIDAPHHVAKGASDPGNADRGRGASAFKDAARLVYTLATMTSDEAETFGIGEAERRLLIRVDSAKVNLVPAAAQATWFRLIGVPLNNGNEEYPHGDEVQTVEPWTPPAVWDGLSHQLLNEILTAIDKGLPDERRYSDHGAARDRAAWNVVVQYAPNKTPDQARQIIKTWVKNGVLLVEDYDDPARREPAKGLKVDNAKRPS